MFLENSAPVWLDVLSFQFKKQIVRICNSVILSTSEWYKNRLKIKAFLPKIWIIETSGLTVFEQFSAFYLPQRVQMSSTLVTIHTVFKVLLFEKFFWTSAFPQVYPLAAHCILEIHLPSCALQLSIVLSRLSWNLLRICRLGEMSCTGVVCCWTDSLSSFRSISALLRSGKRKRN